MSKLTLQEILKAAETREQADFLPEAKGMTIKEIAKLCKVARRTVERWAHKIADNPGHFDQGLAEKLAEAEKSGKDPARFTLEETLAIIGEGGGNETLASLLADTLDPRIIFHTAARMLGYTGGYGRREPAGEAAGKVYELQQKYKYEEKVAKQDVLTLFRCAIDLSHYFHNTVSFIDTLVIQNNTMEEKVAVIMKRLDEVAKLQAEGGDVPVIQSREWWDETRECFHSGRYRREAVEELAALEDKTGLAKDALDALVERARTAGAARPGKVIEFKPEGKTGA